MDFVQRLGSRIGSAFIDGGIHPRFGTRNFTLPLRNGHYLEVVCPLDHPAAEESPFGKAVSKRAEAASHSSDGSLNAVITPKKSRWMQAWMQLKGIEAYIGQQITARMSVD